MRLSEEQQQIIKQVAREILGQDCPVFLFGSRTDDTRRGGDIDLLIQAKYSVEARSHKELKIVARLQRLLGDQPIDVLIIDPDTVHQPIHEQALHTGITL